MEDPELSAARLGTGGCGRGAARGRARRSPWPGSIAASAPRPGVASPCWQSHRNNEGTRCSVVAEVQNHQDALANTFQGHGWLWLYF